MTKAELVIDIYRRLPPDAQREAIDFMLMLKTKVDPMSRTVSS